VRILRTTFALLAGIVASIGVAVFAGESVTLLLTVFWNSIFGSWYDFGMCLAYAVPLIFTGLSVAIVFQIGLFNIGAEGQLAMGCLGATMFALFFPNVPLLLAVPGAVVASALFSGFWGFVPGWILAKRGGHEVISTIMLNFLGSLLTSYVVLEHLRNLETSNPESRTIPSQFHLSKFTMFSDTPLSTALFVSLIAALLCWLVLFRTKIGFRMRSIGSNIEAARSAGYPVEKIQVLTFEYGFTGIAVALLARAHPIAVVPSAVLFGWLLKGASDLEFQSEFVTRDLALVMRALILLAVVLEGIVFGELGKKLLAGKKK
jgi:general nucleoside transport system permease protein